MSEFFKRPQEQNTYGYQMNCSSTKFSSKQIHFEQLPTQHQKVEEGVSFDFKIYNTDEKYAANQSCEDNLTHTNQEKTTVDFKQLRIQFQNFEKEISSKYCGRRESFN